MSTAEKTSNKNLEKIGWLIAIITAGLIAAFLYYFNLFLAGLQVAKSYEELNKVAESPLDDDFLKHPVFRPLYEPNLAKARFSLETVLLVQDKQYSEAAKKIKRSQSDDNQKASRLRDKLKKLTKENDQSDESHLEVLKQSKSLLIEMAEFPIENDTRDVYASWKSTLEGRGYSLPKLPPVS